MSLGLSLTSFAQIDLKNPPWETGCDSLTTQTEMNICSGEKLHIADSILNLYYNRLITYVDSLYTNELNDSNGKQDNYEKDYLKQLKGQKEAIIKSQIDFQKFLNSTTDIIGYQYKGGSMRPMMVNIYALDLTVNQIKILMNLMEEIIDR
jgi:uncharacterized protein YecT (DUF1311 family)